MLVKINRVILMTVLLMIFCIYAVSASGSSEAKKDTLVVLSHQVHANCATGTSPENDITKEFMDRNSLNQIEWRTYGTAELAEKLFREASLRNTPVDIGYLLNSSSSPVITSLFEPLDGYMKKTPIEEFGDFSKGMLDPFTFDNELYATPVRVAVSLMHANVAIFEERGVPYPPKNIEEIFDAAKKLTYTKPNGEKVYGMVIFGLPSVVGDPVLAFARAWPNVDFVSSDYQVMINDKPIVQIIDRFKDLIDSGVMPQETTSIGINDMISYFQSGRAAMCWGASGYNAVFNDPKISKVAGNVKSFAVPASIDSPKSVSVADGVCNIWAMVIPRGAQNKELSWDFIRHLSTKKSVLQMALNGNGPARLSTYDEPDFIKSDPELAAAIKQVLNTGRPAWPGFENTSQAQEALGREIHLALLGRKSAQQAMDDAKKEIEELVPKK